MSKWPPPGHSFSYRLTVKLDNRYELSCDLTVPSAMRDLLDLSTVRLGRHGGPTEADLGFRRDLHERVGAVAVAGGHVEAAMKRLLLLLRGDSGRFSLVDKNWTQLHKELAQECNAADPRRALLGATLEWAEQNRIKDRRDNVIHAYWWIYDGCGVVRSRYFRRSDGAMMVGSMEDLERDAELLTEYARRLDELLREDWSRALLPPD